jgi:hypothetical protein
MWLVLGLKAVATKSRCRTIFDRNQWVAYGTSAVVDSVAAVGVGVVFVLGFTGPELLGPHPMEVARRLQRRSKASKIPGRIKLLYDNARPPIELARRVKKKSSGRLNTNSNTYDSKRLAGSDATRTCQSFKLELTN